MGFPGGSAGKESACSVGDLGSIPGLGRSPGEGNGYPLQYSGLQNSMDCIVHGVAKSWTRLEWLLLSFTFFKLCPMNPVSRYSGILEESSCTLYFSIMISKISWLVTFSCRNESVCKWVSDPFGHGAAHLLLPFTLSQPEPLIPGQATGKVGTCRLLILLWSAAPMRYLHAFEYMNIFIFFQWGLSHSLAIPEISRWTQLQRILAE